MFREGCLIRRELLYRQPDRHPISLNKMLPLERYESYIVSIYVVIKHCIGFPGKKSVIRLMTCMTKYIITYRTVTVYRAAIHYLALCQWLEGSLLQVLASHQQGWLPSREPSVITVLKGLM